MYYFLKALHALYDIIQIKGMSSLILLSQIRIREGRKGSMSGYICIHGGRAAKSEILSCSRWGQRKVIGSGKSSPRRSQRLRQPRSIWKSKAWSLLTSQVLEWESLERAEELGYKWWVSHLTDTLQSLHHVLAEESQENKWLSFKFQEQDRGDRQNVTFPIRLIPQPPMLKGNDQREEKTHKHTDRRKPEFPTAESRALYFFYLFVKSIPYPLYKIKK